jgi:hypothetical protein
MLSACERCGERQAPAELELDVTGKYCCRRCRAHIAVATADDSLAEQGIVRTCGRCGQRAMRPEQETYTVPSRASNDREARFTLGFRYRCAECSARAWFFRPGALAFLVVALVPGFLLMLVVEPTHPYGWHRGRRGGIAFSMGPVPLWIRVLVALSIPAALIAYDQWQRRRNPPA